MGDEHDGRVERGERLLEPLERADVEMVGGLVEQQHVGAGRQRARQRGARQLAAAERIERTLEVDVAKAEPVCVPVARCAQISSRSAALCGRDSG